MKALSLWQPWATLIAIGAKRIETRSWSTNYRGPLLIHAAKKWSTENMALCYDEPFFSALKSAPALDDMLPLPFGCIIAVAELHDCLRICRYGWRDEMPPPPEPELSFGNYEAGRYAWLLPNVRQFKTPIPFTGHQGIFNVPDSIVADQLAATDH